MTSKVTVDAHAGWDIEVKVEEKEYVPEGLEVMGVTPWKCSTILVEGGTKEDIYIWETKRITSIRELPRT